MISAPSARQAGSSETAAALQRCFVEGTHNPPMCQAGGAKAEHPGLRAGGRVCAARC